MLLYSSVDKIFLFHSHIFFDSLLETTTGLTSELIISKSPTEHPVSITMSFDAIPVLDLSAARSPDTKPSFLDSLRHALLEVGFLYIKNTGISEQLIDEVILEGKKFFDLPTEKKLEVEMKNAASFLGMQPWTVS